MPTSVGMIKTKGLHAIVEAAGNLVKTAHITLVGYEKSTNGSVTVILLAR